MQLGHADGAILRCTALVEDGQNDIARNELEAARAKFPNDPRFVMLLGFLLTSRFDDLESAIALLRTALLAHPHDIGIANNLLRADEVGNSFRSARSLLALSERN